jgi:hypothetical protein
MSDRDIRQSLTQLPTGLYDAYGRMLQHLETSVSGNKRSRTFASRLFQWIAFSFRPLTLSELCVAISIENDDQDLDPSSVITDPWAILKIGGCLLAYDYESGCVSFAHPTIRDFLIQLESRYSFSTSLPLEVEIPNYPSGSFAIGNLPKCVRRTPSVDATPRSG